MSTLKSVIHMLVIVMTKLEPIFSTFRLINSGKHAHSENKMKIAADLQIKYS